MLVYVEESVLKAADDREVEREAFRAKLANLASVHDTYTAKCADLAREIEAEPGHNNSNAKEKRKRAAQLKAEAEEVRKEMDEAESIGFVRSSDGIVFGERFPLYLRNYVERDRAEFDKRMEADRTEMTEVRKVRKRVAAEMKRIAQNLIFDAEAEEVKGHELEFLPTNFLAEFFAKTEFKDVKDKCDFSVYRCSHGHMDLNRSVQ